MKFSRLFVLLLAASLLVAACASGPGAADPTAQPTEAMPVTGATAAATGTTPPDEQPAQAAAAATETAPPAQAEATAAPGESANTPAPDTAAAALPPLDCAAPAGLTPAQTAGPYFTPDSPEKASLLEEGMEGTRLVLEGYVLAADCSPVPNAKVDFWQADAAGVYDNQGYRLRGHQFSDENGYYRLETVLPGEYPGRPPHIHVKVIPPGGPELTSQVYFPGSAGNQSDRIFNPDLTVTVTSEAQDSLQARFDFVVETR